MAVIESTKVCQQQEECQQQMELHDLIPQSNDYRIIDYSQRNFPSVYQDMISREPNEQVNATILHKEVLQGWICASRMYYIHNATSSDMHSKIQIPRVRSTVIIIRGKKKFHKFLEIRINTTLQALLVCM